MVLGLKLKINTTTFNQLPKSVQKIIQEMIDQLAPEKIILFGSRARGDFRENSDFDIAVVLPANQSSNFTKFSVDLNEEAKTLFQIDLVELNKLDNNYQNNIKREGKIIYG